MKRKLMAVFLVAAMCLAGCSGGSSTTATTEVPATEAEQETEAETESNVTDNSEEASDFDPKEFLDWFRAEDRYKTVGAVAKEEGARTGFIQDASGRPTKEDMADILDFTSKAVASGGENDIYFIVIEDTDTQIKLVGTNNGAYAGDGTVTVLVYSERLVAEENQISEDGTVYKYQVDRGYYDAGIASGYLNIAATAYGYRTHMFQDNPGGTGFRSDAYDQYLKDEDGNWLIYRNGDTTSATWYGDHPAENLKFLCAIVIGTMDPDMDIDGFTGATSRSEYPANYAYWSGYTDPVEEIVYETADNEYVDSAAGMGGDVVVKVTVEDGVITDVEVLAESETVGIGSDAIEQLPDQFIGLSDADEIDAIDGISGATITSNALKEAVKGALEQAQ